MFEVIYYSRSGSTKKIAEAIAAELGVRAEDAKMNKGLAKDSFVFLGSGYYERKPEKELQEFINGNDFAGRQVALFGTSARGKGNEIRAIEKLLKPKGALIRDSFYCKGKSWRFFINRGHPSNEDFANAREFASKMKKLSSKTARERNEKI